MFGVIGTVLLTISHAVTPTVAVETENGVVSSAASEIADVQASNSQAVKFGTSVGHTTVCPPFPVFPDANCTGYAHTGVTLTRVPSQATSGIGWTWNGYAVATTSANATISGLDISGGFEDTKGGVTFKNSYVRCNDITDWCLSVGSNASVMDVEVGGGSDGATMQVATGVWTGGPNNVFRRMNIHHVSDGMRVDGGTSIYDSYIHRLIMNEAPSPGAHSDGSQTTAGSTPIVFDHDTVEGGSNDSLFFEVGSSAITVNHCFLKFVSLNGVSSSFGIGSGNGASIAITNNVFSNEFKPGAAINNSISPATITGNTFQDGSVVQ